MLKFVEVIEGKLTEGRDSDRNLMVQIHNQYLKKLGFISIESTPDELRQIAAKLIELNGGNTLQFIEQDDGVINIKHECGSAIGDLVKRDGVYRLTFLYTYDNADGLYQIADKLKQLNGDQDA